MLALPLWDVITFYCRPHTKAMYRFFHGKIAFLPLK
jgi:hypothetical protein